MLEFLSIGSHSSKCCPAVKEKVQVDVMQAHVALAWGRPAGRRSRAASYPALASRSTLAAAADAPLPDVAAAAGDAAAAMPDDDNGGVLFGFRRMRGHSLPMSWRGLAMEEAAAAEPSS